MVSVGRSGAMELADEAVFTVARLVIPWYQMGLYPQHDAILVTVVVVWFMSSPVRVAHRRFPDKGIGRSVAQIRSPVKVVLVHGVTSSGCPKGCSMRAIRGASPGYSLKPTLLPRVPMKQPYKQSISRLLQLTNNILHQLLSSTYEDEISLWPGQSRRTVCQWQFAKRTVYTLLNADSNHTFLACVLMIDSAMPFMSGFTHGGH